MALLRLRPLALSALVFCAAVLFCLFLSSGVLWEIGAVALALLCCLLPLFIKKRGGYVRLCLILICLAVLLACVRGGLFAVRRERAEMLSGEFIEAELVVRDVLQQSSYSCELLVSVTVSDDLPHSLAVLRAESPLPFYLGDRISGEFYVENLAFEAYRPGVEYEYLGEGAAWLLIPTQLDALVLCESFIRDLDSEWTHPLFYIWGHSHEFRTEEDWAYIEKVVATLANNDKIWYAANIDIYNYVTAQAQLQISYDETMFYNPTATDVWVERNKREIIKIPAGQRIVVPFA